jgi:molybdenum cofactor cytidylyltransferase
VQVTAIVLAAGSSTRLGRPKQLLEIDGETLLARATRVAREALHGLAGNVVVIVPPSLGVEGLVNHHADEGIASSIRLGVRACEGDVLLVLCDQPRITAAHLRALVDAHASIAATAYDGILGVPAYFAAAFRDELLALRGDAGARRVIEAHRDLVVAVPFAEAAFDVDTEADAARLGT